MINWQKYNYWAKWKLIWMQTTCITLTSLEKNMTVFSGMFCFSFYLFPYISIIFIWLKTKCCTKGTNSSDLNDISLFRSVHCTKILLLIIIRSIVDESEDGLGQSQNGPVFHNSVFCLIFFWGGGGFRCLVFWYSVFCTKQKDRHNLQCFDTSSNPMPLKKSSYMYLSYLKI